MTPTFVDDVAPRVIGRSPAAGAVNVSRHLTATVRFDEPVTGVSSTSVRLRDTVTGGVVPATVTYDGSRNEARASVASTLAAERVYRLELTSAISDTTGHALVATSWTFTTGISGFSDSIRFAVRVRHRLAGRERHHRRLRRQDLLPALAGHA